MRWKESTLGAAVEPEGLIQTGPFGSQLHQSDYVSDGIPVIMPKDISDGRINAETVARVSEETAMRLRRHRLCPRSIILPRRGEITKRAWIDDEQAGWLCGTGCLQIVVEGTGLVPEFLYYYMEQDHVVRWLEQHAVGTTMLNLSASIVANLPVRYPPPDIQQRIASILSAYDDLIENNRRRIQLLEDAARLLYREWFVRLRFPGHEHAKIKDGVPEGWEKVSFGQLCEEIKEMCLPAAMEPDTPYIGLEHMPRRSIALSEWGTAEQVTSSKHRFREGDVLFGKIRPYFHKVGIALTDGVASSDAIVLRPISQELLPLVLMVASSDAFVADTAQKMKEGSKMPRADWKQMQQYPVFQPSDGVLLAFNEFINPVLEQLKVLVFANRSLCLGRDLLLPKLMSGEVAV